MTHQTVYVLFKSICIRACYLNEVISLNCFRNPGSAVPLPLVSHCGPTASSGKSPGCFTLLLEQWRPLGSWKHLLQLIFRSCIWVSRFFVSQTLWLSFYHWCCQILYPGHLYAAEVVKKLSALLYKWFLSELIKEKMMPRAKLCPLMFFITSAKLSFVICIVKYRFFFQWKMANNDFNLNTIACFAKATLRYSV